MTETTQTPAPGLWAALQALFSSLGTWMPSKETVWSAVFYAALASGFTAAGAYIHEKVSPGKIVVVKDQEAINTAVEKETYAVKQQLFAVQGMTIDGIADQCANAVKQVIADSKKKK